MSEFKKSYMYKYSWLPGGVFFSVLKIATFCQFVFLFLFLQIRDMFNYRNLHHNMVALSGFLNGVNFILIHQVAARHRPYA